MHNNTSEEEVFDEKLYLLHNPDVARAIALRQFSSGFDHFTKFGRYENRPGVSIPTGAINAQTTHPYPPEHLRFRVHGGRDLEGYVRLGKMVTDDLLRALQSGWVRVPEEGKVLDFGCGPGRVITWLQQQRKDLQFYGTDIDAEAIDWAQRNLSAMATFDCNRTMPPLDYESGTFDLIYSISIFTHLPEDMQTAWLAELKRITKPGGYLILTTHAEHLLSRNTERMPKNGFYYSVSNGTDGLPDFYQTSFQTSAYIEREWSKIFKIEKIVSRGVANHQDMIICRN
jgi:SAM-dependent methyltransferase